MSDVGQTTNQSHPTPMKYEQQPLYVGSKDDESKKSSCKAINPTDLIIGKDDLNNSALSPKTVVNRGDPSNLRETDGIERTAPFRSPVNGAAPKTPTGQGKISQLPTIMKSPNSVNFEGSKQPLPSASSFVATELNPYKETMAKDPVLKLDIFSEVSQRAVPSQEQMSSSLKQTADHYIQYAQDHSQSQHQASRENQARPHFVVGAPDQSHGSSSIGQQAVERQIAEVKPFHESYEVSRKSQKIQGQFQKVKGQDSFEASHKSQKVHASLVEHIAHTHDSQQASHENPRARVAGQIDTYEDAPQAESHGHSQVASQADPAVAAQITEFVVINDPTGDPPTVSVDNSRMFMGSHLDRPVDKKRTAELADKFSSMSKDSLTGDATGELFSPKEGSRAYLVKSKMSTKQKSPRGRGSRMKKSPKAKGEKRKSPSSSRHHLESSSSRHKTLNQITNETMRRPRAYRITGKPEGISNIANKTSPANGQGFGHKKSGGLFTPSLISSTPNTITPQDALKNQKYAMNATGTLLPKIENPSRPPSSHHEPSAEGDNLYGAKASKVKSQFVKEASKATNRFYDKHVSKIYDKFIGQQIHLNRLHEIKEDIEEMRKPAFDPNMLPKDRAKNFTFRALQTSDMAKCIYQKNRVTHQEYKKNWENQEIFKENQKLKKKIDTIQEKGSGLQKQASLGGSQAMFPMTQIPSVQQISPAQAHYKQSEKTLHYVYRKQEDQRIFEENQRMAKRLTTQSSILEVIRHRTTERQRPKPLSSSKQKEDGEAQIKKKLKPAHSKAQSIDIQHLVHRHRKRIDNAQGHFSSSKQPDKTQFLPQKQELERLKMFQTQFQNHLSSSKKKLSTKQFDSMPATTRNKQLTPVIQGSSKESPAGQALEKTAEDVTQPSALKTAEEGQVATGEATSFVEQATTPENNVLYEIDQEYAKNKAKPAPFPQEGRTSLQATTADYLKTGTITSKIPEASHESKTKGDYTNNSLTRERGDTSYESKKTPKSAKTMSVNPPKRSNPSRIYAHSKKRQLSPRPGPTSPPFQQNQDLTKIIDQSQFIVNPSFGNLNYTVQPAPAAPSPPIDGAGQVGRVQADQLGAIKLNQSSARELDEAELHPVPPFAQQSDVRMLLNQNSSTLVQDESTEENYPLQNFALPQQPEQHEDSPMFPSTAEVPGQSMPISPLDTVPIAAGTYDGHPGSMGLAALINPVPGAKPKDSNLKQASAIYGSQPKKVEMKQKTRLDQKIQKYKLLQKGEKPPKADHLNYDLQPQQIPSPRFGQQKITNIKRTIKIGERDSIHTIEPKSTTTLEPPSTRISKIDKMQKQQNDEKVQRLQSTDRLTLDSPPPAKGKKKYLHVKHHVKQSDHLAKWATNNNSQQSIGLNVSSPKLIIVPQNIISMKDLASQTNFKDPTPKEPQRGVIGDLQAELQMNSQPSVNNGKFSVLADVKGETDLQKTDGMPLSLPEEPSPIIEGASDQQTNLPAEEKAEEVPSKTDNLDPTPASLNHAGSPAPDLPEEISQHLKDDDLPSPKATSQKAAADFFDKDHEAPEEQKPSGSNKTGSEEQQSEIKDDYDG